MQVCSLKIDSINVDDAINHVKQLLETERDLSPALTTVRLSKLYLRLHELPEFERFSFLLGRGNQVNHRLTLE